MSDEDVRKNLSETSTKGPVFECTFDGGVWPGATKGSRLSITRSGQHLYVGTRTMRIDRVDKSGPFGAYISFSVAGGDERLSIDGMASERERRPTYLTRRSGGKTETFSCASQGVSAADVFDDAQLDVLVTLTNGTR